MNKSKSLLTILVVLLLGLGWYLLSKDSAQDSPKSAPAYGDSMADPERPVFSAQEDTLKEDTTEGQTTPPPVGQDLAPGTALVKVTVISDDYDRQANMALTVKAVEILGYGPATSPIAAQQELEIRVERFLKNNSDYENLMQKGKTLTIVISSEKEMNLGDSPGKESWSLIGVKSQ